MPRFFAALALLLLGYQTVVAMLFVGETRYRVPWDFLIALLAAAAVMRDRPPHPRSARERERVAGRARRPSTRERRDERRPPLRVEQVVVVEVRVHVLR